MKILKIHIFSLAYILPVHLNEFVPHVTTLVITHHELSAGVCHIVQSRRIPGQDYFASWTATDLLEDDTEVSLG